MMKKSLKSKRKKADSTATSGNKKAISGCQMILCEDPLTGAIRLFPVSCPEGYVKMVKNKAREKGIRFSSEPFPEDAFLSVPEEPFPEDAFLSVPEEE